jgi:hypothetical protein
MSDNPEINPWYPIAVAILILESTSTKLTGFSSVLTDFYTEKETWVSLSIVTSSKDTEN